LRFSKKGIPVIGIDKVDYGIAAENFKFIKKKVEEYVFKSRFDLIICSLVLHFLEKKDAIDLIKKIQYNTIKGGYNLLICLCHKDKGADNYPYKYYPQIEDVLRLYSNWEIIEKKQDILFPVEHNGNIHQHHVIFLFVKKLVNYSFN